MSHQHTVSKQTNLSMTFFATEIINGVHDGANFFMLFSQSIDVSVYKLSLLASQNSPLMQTVMQTLTKKHILNHCMWCSLIWGVYLKCLQTSTNHSSTSQVAWWHCIKIISCQRPGNPPAICKQGSYPMTH